jgi:uncharacterized protein (DUF2141 family)
MKRFFALLALSTASIAMATDLVINVQNVQPGKGTIKAALYSKAENFLVDPLRHASVAAGANTVRLKMDGLAPGEYAVSIYQDLNGNEKLDKNFFKIPNEPTGTSNDAPALRGPPSYDQARFNLPEAGKEISITLYK